MPQKSVAKKKTSKYENKTKPTKVSWQKFLETEDFSLEQKQDAKTLVALFEEITGFKTIMWGKIFGYGTYHYVGKSREDD